jgi:hypothetical protein
MKRLATVVILAVAFMMISSSAAFASSVHFKNNTTPSVRDNGLTASASGALSGLGNGDILIRLIATGIPEAYCVNPGTGEHRPPGQNPAEITLVGTLFIPSTDVKNGNVSFTVTTAGPITPTPKEAGCPSNKWTVEIVDIVFTSATIQVFQDANGQNGIFDGPGTLVLEEDIL